MPTGPLSDAGPRTSRLHRVRKKPVLIVLGVAAVVTLLVPSLPFVIAITLIGLPITVFLLLAPFLFLVFAGTVWAGPRLGGGWMGHGMGLVLALAALALPAALGNHLLERRAKALLADDHDDGSAFAARTVALRSDSAGAFGKGETRCGEFCLRMLLAGVAQRVLVAREAPDVALDPARGVDAFSIERRDACPPVKLRHGADPDFTAPLAPPDPKAQRADERMQLEIAKGRCLIAESALLGTADAVISVGTVHRPQSARWWNPFADTVQAHRITLQVMRDGAFVEAYRRTGVVMRKLGAFYAPTADAGALADFGVEGGRTLLRLLDEVQASQGSRDHGAAQLRERAVQGLCRLGATGRELVPQVYARIDAGTLALYGGHWESIIRTLTAMGETPDRMWEHLHSEDKSRTRERLDRAVERERKRPTCGV